MSTSVAPWIAALGCVGVAAAAWLAPLGASATTVSLSVTTEPRPSEPRPAVARGEPDVQPRTPPRDEIADEVLFVEHGGSFWPSSVVERQSDGRVKIHYLGWGSESDEVIEPSRIRRRSKTSAGQLMVEWHGSYWPATALRTEGNRSFIRYDGYGSEWDEWVGPDRTARFSPPSR